MDRDPREGVLRLAAAGVDEPIAGLRDAEPAHIFLRVNPTGRQTRQHPMVVERDDERVFGLVIAAQPEDEGRGGARRPVDVAEVATATGDPPAVGNARFVWLPSSAAATRATSHAPSGDALMKYKTGRSTTRRNSPRWPIR